MKIKCLVIDDEPLARKLIVSHISKIESLEMVGECANAIEAGNFLRMSKADLLFLDIQMPEINGLQFIGTLKNPPAIILTTAYRDFAPEAFDLDVVDYLLKPISFDRFTKSVNKYFDKRLEGKTSDVLDPNKSSAFIYLKADRKNHKILLKEIIYIESLDDYVKVHLKEVTLVTRENISSLEAILPTGIFVRIHRSFIINTHYISAISSDSIEIKGKELPIGRAFKKSALALLNLKLSKEQNP
jgi:DNA-binding LytR/AlgR family response regulator